MTKIHLASERERERSEAAGKPAASEDSGEAAAAYASSESTRGIRNHGYLPACLPAFLRAVEGREFQDPEPLRLDPFFATTTNYSSFGNFHVLGTVDTAGKTETS